MAIAENLTSDSLVWSRDFELERSRPPAWAPGRWTRKMEEGATAHASDTSGASVELFDHDHDGRSARALRTRNSPSQWPGGLPGRPVGPGRRRDEDRDRR
jgi:hypothetical protein